MIESDREERERMSNSNKIGSDWKDRETLQKFNSYNDTRGFSQQIRYVYFFFNSVASNFNERENSSHTSPLSKKYRFVDSI